MNAFIKKTLPAKDHNKLISILTDEFKKSIYRLDLYQKPRYRLINFITFLSVKAIQKALQKLGKSAELYPSILNKHKSIFSFVVGDEIYKKDTDGFFENLTMERH